jgi:hypothetical protein
VSRYAVLGAGLLAALALGCGEPEVLDGVAVQPVATAEAWQLLASNDRDDPFIGFRRGRVVCEDYATLIEGRTYEIATDVCNYATAAQPLGVAIEAGSTMGATVAHFPISAPGASKAHLVLQIGETEMWHQEIALPATQAVYEPRWTLDEAVPEGTLLYFHVRNHGTNAWFIADVSVNPGPPRGE